MATPVLKLPHDAEGKLIARPNRFLALVDINSRKEKVHVHDPGRLEELLYPGNGVLVRKASSPNRKTGWDLLAARFGKMWIFVNSAHHSSIAEAVLRNDDISPFRGVRTLRPEVRFGSSRLDFFLQLRDNSEVWVEVKGCTLTQHGKALFPDAPTKRGARHMRELTTIAREGSRAAALILVFRQDSQCFAPNRETDPEFASAFWLALEAGVEVHPLLFSYTEDWIIFHREIPLCPKPMM